MAIPRALLRFSLRAVMVLVLLCGVLLAWATQSNHRRARAVEEINAAGGKITYALVEGESMLGKYLNSVPKVHSISLEEVKTTSELLANLRAFPEIIDLDLADT